MRIGQRSKQSTRQGISTLECVLLLVAGAVFFGAGFLAMSLGTSS